MGGRVLRRQVNRSSRGAVVVDSGSLSQRCGAGSPRQSYLTLLQRHYCHIILPGSAPGQ